MCPLDWRLFLPESWNAVKAGPAAVKAAKAKQHRTLSSARRAAPPAAPAGNEIDVEAVTEAARQRRLRSAIPDSEGHRPKWTLGDGCNSHRRRAT
ncbi:hypothetical protein GCM10010199_17690 [Dactylosporangium roseum]